VIEKLVDEALAKYPNTLEKDIEILSKDEKKEYVLTTN